jgi:hypothetical protein
MAAEGIDWVNCSWNSALNYGESLLAYKHNKTITGLCPKHTNIPERP